jgi:5-methyltetrahydropteroyltriglutamate--homocysteine methyltransferase
MGHLLPLHPSYSRYGSGCYKDIPLKRRRMHRPPFRADHIGSLLRPARLRHAFRAFSAGELDNEHFAAAQDAAILDAINLQQDAGFAVVTDGEFRRGSYWSRFVERIEGLGVAEALFRFHDEQGEELAFTAPRVTGRLTRREPIALDEFIFLRDNAAALPKVTFPAPSTMHFWRGAAYASPGLHSNPREFFRELGALCRAEIADLAAAGCRYIQLDEVALAMLCDPAVRARVSADGADAEGLVALYVDAIAEAVAGAPPNMAVGVHMCRGNFKGKYLAEGGYDSIARALFNVPGVTHFLLEFDTARAGDFAPLRHMAADKGVVLGLISSKVAALETLDDLLARIDEAARFVDRDRLAVSPQCGFASTVAGNPVDEAAQRSKLSLTVRVANAAWT